MEPIMIVFLIILMLLPIVLCLYLIVFYSIFRRYFSRKGRFLKELNKTFSTQIHGEENFESFKKLTIEKDINLVGFYKNNGKNKLALMFHSLGADHRQLSRAGEMFEREGFDLLAVDLRGHGESGGETTYGKEEVDDLLDWLDEMKAQNANYKFLLFGVGLGGTVVNLSLSQSISDVLVAISDSAFDNAKKELSFIFSKRKIKFPQLNNSFFNYMKRSRQIDLSKIDSCESVKKSKIPLMLIHAGADQIVPVEMGYNIQNVLPNFNKNLLIIEDALHGQSLEQNSSLYSMKVSKFLRQHGI